MVEGGLNLSHWPGNRTPAHLKADTSTEMALKLARDPGREEWLRGVSIVTNNHFDTDGLLSLYAVLRPEEALRHEKEMIQAARTGDFGEFLRIRDRALAAELPEIQGAMRKYLSPGRRIVVQGEPK